jgi:hypothetical protein
VSEKQEPSEEAFAAIAKHITVEPQADRFVITVGHKLVDDPIYELYNTEASANHTAYALANAFARLIDDFAAKKVEEDRARIAERLDAKRKWDEQLAEQAFVEGKDPAFVAIHRRATSQWGTAIAIAKTGGEA